MEGRESLFSLEVVVDQLILADVTCRFPAIAFRLLDFPTLIIEHVESDTASKIISALKIDVERKIPRQFNELKDRDGKFNVKKGKSCLFKIAIDTLRGHLANTPLYVLLTDNFQEPPKLVGSCIFSLHETVESIFAKVAKSGLSVPVVHGEKGTFKLFNLMGIEIGEIDLAVRMLSLGQGLIQHIPASAIATHQTTNVVADENPLLSPSKTKQNENFIKPNYRDVVIQDLELPAEDDFNPAAVSSVSLGLQTLITPEAKPTATQTADDKQTQTVKKRVVHFGEEDLFISNTFCPPPLYFHNNEEEKRPLPQYQIFHFENVKEDQDDVESIRSDDAFYDTLEEGLDQTQIKPNIISYVTYQQPKPVIVESPTKLTQVVPQPPNLRDMLNSPRYQAEQFPFLRALMAELNFMQLGSPVATGLPQTVKHRSRSPPKAKAAWHGINNEEKENQSDFLARLSTPKNVAPKDHNICVRKSHHDCTHAGQAVPKQKSWIRKQPIYEQKKSKLHYGLTNTMRLRLAATNPEMLKSLEEEELANKTFKVKQASYNEKSSSLKNTGKKSTRTPPPKHPNNGSQRRPVPTPRRPSLKTPDPVELSLSADDEEYDRSKYVISEESTPRSIEIHVPSAYSQDNSDDDDNEESFSKENQSEIKVQYATNIITDPLIDDKPPTGRQTFPPSSMKAATVKLVYNSRLGQYSDEFDDTRQWMSTDEPELQEIHDSDESPSDKSTVKPITAHGEPGRSVRDSQKLVINPRSSDKSPVTAIRMSQSLPFSHISESGHDSPTPRPRRLSTADDKPLGLRRSVSFEGADESELTSINAGHGRRSLSPLSPLSSSHENLPLHGFMQKHASVLPKITSKSSKSNDDTKSKRQGSKLPISLHADSLSSYMPSDLELENLANISVEDDYSEDFEDSEKDYNPFSNIPSAMLGYTA